MSGEGVAMTLGAILTLSCVGCREVVHFRVRLDGGQITHTAPLQDDSDRKWFMGTDEVWCSNCKSEGEA